MRRSTWQGLGLLALAGLMAVACPITFALGVAIGSDEPSLARPFQIGALVLAPLALAVGIAGVVRLVARSRS